MRLIIEAHLVYNEGSTERIELASIERAMTSVRAPGTPCQRCCGTGVF